MKYRKVHTGSQYVRIVMRHCFVGGTEEWIGTYIHIFRNHKRSVRKNWKTEFAHPQVRWWGEEDE